MDARYRSIIANVEQIVRAKLSGLPHAYRYHGLEHTEQVVRNALAIAEAERLPGDDRSSATELPLLLISAWLHDVMIDTFYVGHEAAACRFVDAYFAGADSLFTGTLTMTEIDRIKSSIMATKLPQEAPHQLAAILADADLLYLGTNQFFPWSGRLREEHLHILRRTYTDTEWTEINIRFLREHTYYTPFARNYCERGIETNLSLLTGELDAPSM